MIEETNIPPGPSSPARPADLAKSIGADYQSNLSGQPVSANFIEVIPIEFARKFEMVGFASEDNHLPIAVTSREGWLKTDVVARLMNVEVHPFFSEPEQVLAAINSGYEQKTGEAELLLEAFEEQGVANGLADFRREDLLNSSDRAPVIKLVNLLILDAVRRNASDIHLQPQENRMVVRMRIDGVLEDTFEVPKASQEEVLSRVKVLGHMDIAEKRLPQDGRASVQLGDRLIDLRIASLPASFGERIVIRLLDKSAELFTLEEIGMSAASLARWRKLIKLEHGLILVTGPTGSGKSTTLYAALQEIDTVNRNALTLEDPIEYQLDGISQTQVNTKKGMTFAKGLRNVLRQDPDIIMVGEIRDRETAIMAIQASLTGHLVFSTLHTNDAASAVTRLMDLGVEPYLIGSSLVGVLAQRLVRRVCQQCAVKKEGVAGLEQLGVSSIDYPELWEGQGCEACRETGYSGRMGLFELLTLNDPIRKLIQMKGTAAELRDAAIDQGMELLRHDGLRRMREGKTSLDEVIRVTARSQL